MTKTMGRCSPKNRMRLFCLQLEAACLQLSSFTYSCVWEFLCLQFELLYLQFELFCLQLSDFSHRRTLYRVSRFASRTREIYCNPVNLVQIHFGPPARNGDENGWKMDFGLTWEWGENSRKMEKWPENPSHFLAIFLPFSRPFFSHFPGEAKIHVSAPFSSPFRAGGPKWICTRSTGLQTYEQKPLVHESSSWQRAQGWVKAFWRQRWGTRKEEIGHKLICQRQSWKPSPLKSNLAGEAIRSP